MDGRVHAEKELTSAEALPSDSAVIPFINVPKLPPEKVAPIGISEEFEPRLVDRPSINSLPKQAILIEASSTKEEHLEIKIIFRRSIWNVPPVAVLRVQRSKSHPSQNPRRLSKL
jgi:hypothetical protein